MPGLVIKLAPHERIYINGAVIENGPRRAELRLLQRNTEILRERDIIVTHAATDPLATACVLAQMALMQSRREPGTILTRLRAQFRRLLRDPAHRDDAQVLAAARHLSEGSVSGAHHNLLRALRDRRHPSAATTPLTGPADIPEGTHAAAQ